jgi:hypothetical protein
MSFSDILHCVKHSKGMNGTCNLYERYQYVLTHEARQHWIKTQCK